MDERKEKKPDDRRLIEDYLPIQALSAEGAREKSLRKGHPSTVHLWWARRPLVAARAAVYASLVPASTAKERKKAAKFVAELCQYPGSPSLIAEAEARLLAAHAERLSREKGEPVTADDIRAGRAPRPKVLDMFAGGGTIPLEALRLGCEGIALDLNPVAHIVELCTLVLPQKFGKPDPAEFGMTGPARGDKKSTWGGLAKEARYWAEWVQERARREIGDLYPDLPDPASPQVRQEVGSNQLSLAGPGFERSGQQKLAVEQGTGNLTPVAYLWTRTVTCKNPGCGAAVPLVKQTWGRKKKGDFVAFRMEASPGRGRVAFEVVHAPSEAGLGFNPAGGGRSGGVACPFCGTVAASEYVRSQASIGALGTQLMAVACVKPGIQSKVYMPGHEAERYLVPDHLLESRIEEVCGREGISAPAEPVPQGASRSAGGSAFTVHLYGFRTWGSLFTRRQLLALLTFVDAIKAAEREMASYGEATRLAVITILGAMLDRLASFSSMQCVWLGIEGERTANTFSRHALPMIWDFSEASPFNQANASWPVAIEHVISAIERIGGSPPALVERGTATAQSFETESLDAVVTDPPYYDNVPYADISDFFYVWLKRTIGHLYPKHFATELTPKKAEAVADAVRHGGDKGKAGRAYEQMMLDAFREAHRVLKPEAPMVVVYAHKTTLGWATLVDAIRNAGFTVTEAWPLDTEKPGRLRAQDSAALASSIFLVARKRTATGTGSFEDEVRPELASIVRERVETLWEMGISGADLVIAAVGAGLRAYTRFARVEFANGEEVRSADFLAEVEGLVLETLLEKIFGMEGSGVASVDAPSRFYVLWRHAFKTADLDAGEAIVFTYGQGIELDGPNGLSAGQRALLEKKKDRYRLRDFAERGSDRKLGLPDAGEPAPTIDVLHRMLWLIEEEPQGLTAFLDQVSPDLERLRLVAQALAGPGLKGAPGDGPPTVTTSAAEQAALGKLLANWRSLTDRMALFQGSRA